MNNRNILGHITLTLLWSHLFTYCLTTLESELGGGYLHWIGLIWATILATCHIYHQLVAVRKEYA